MIDVVLLIVRLPFVALLYLFLFAIMKTGIGLVRGQRRRTHLELLGGEVRRSCAAYPSSFAPSSWYAAPEPTSWWVPDTCPGRHARFNSGQNLFVDAPGSTNGTGVNGQPITEPTALRNNDVVNVGDVAIRVRFA